MNDVFSIEVASVPDRDQLVAELWIGTEQVAELSQDGRTLILELYASRGGHWAFDFEKFVAAVSAMKERLLPPQDT